MVFLKELPLPPLPLPLSLGALPHPLADEWVGAGFVSFSWGKRFGKGQLEVGWFVDLQPVQRSKVNNLPQPLRRPLKARFLRWLVHRMTLASTADGVFMYHHQRDNSNISSLVFSSSLISASNNKLVRFWQVGDSSPNQVATKTRSAALASTEVTSIFLQAEERTAITIDPDGVVRLWALPTGLRKVSFQAFEADGGHASNARVVGGVLTVVFCEQDSTWKIATWDVEKEDHLQTVALPSGTHVHDHDLRISGDGTRVFGLGMWCIQTWSTSKGTSTGDIPFEWPSRLCSPSFVLDGSRLWIRSENSPAGWDLRNPRSPPLPLTDMPSDGRHLDFIQVDDTNESDTSPTRIEDTITKKEVFRLPERFVQPRVVQWDGRYLVAAFSGTGELLILDFHHMIPR